MFRVEVSLKSLFPLTLANDIREILKKSPMIHDLTHVLSEIAFEWRNIGESLEVPFGELKNIQYDTRPDDRLREALHKWIDLRTSPVTWETLLRVLEIPPVNKPRIADTVRKYLAKDDVFKRYKELEDYQ